MKKSLTLFALILSVILFSNSNLFSQTFQDKMLANLKSLDGKWSGSLEYLDYGDNKSKVTLPATCEAVFNKSGSDKFISLKFIFDEGKGRTVTGEDAWTILDDGKTFFYDSMSYQIKSFDELSNKKDSAVFVFEKDGDDNGKPCLIRQTFTIQPDAYTIVKQVKYTNAGEFFIRHQFSFTRTK